MLSGPIGTNMKPITDGVRLWVRSMNDRGGLDGRPVTLIVGDSGGDPARHRALVQEFVEQKEVTAFVGQPGDVFSGAGSVDYLTQRRVPVVGSEGGANWYHQSPVFFPQMVHGRPLLQTAAVGASREAVRRGKSKLAVWTCVEAQACTDMGEVVPKVAPRHGVQVVNKAKISIGQPDFTAECLNGRNAGAELIFMGADGPTISRAAQSCARQGYRPNWVILGPEILAELHANDANLRGAITLDAVSPWFLHNSPLRKEFHDAVAKFTPTLALTSPTMIGWVAGKVFELAARQVSEPLSRETVLNSLWSIHGDPLGELTGPLLFAPNKAATPTTCYYLASPADGKWTSPDGGQRHCFAYDPGI